MEDIPKERLNEIVDHAYDLKGIELEVYLDSACAGNTTLRARVMECLKGADASVPTGFINEPVPGIQVSDLDSDLYMNGHHQFQEGDTVGVYRILGILGEGGMGEVYLAERNDDQFDRKVAIKIVKAGMGTQEVLMRFQYERQILANLKHPNIAQLLYGDVTDTGLPYFVMEYVEGIPITEYCDQHNLPVRERLELFKTVCDAVRHAQRNLVVHRDLKPSNILVTEEGEVKLLDFGIAKLLAKDGEGQMGYTATGMQSPFTPAYAGPEQVNGEPVNAATDVYALGVILYELLTGRRPYELEKGGLTPANLNLICDHIPTIPSHVVTRRFLNEKSEMPGSLSESRAIEPIKLRRLLRGDVDAIVMKALKKEPERRYPSAAELWSDVNYYLLNRPISARNDSSRYRAIKFVQRHKLSVAAVMFAMLALVSGLVSVVLMNQEIRVQKDQVKQEATKYKAARNFLVGLFEEIDPDKRLGSDISISEFLFLGLDHIDGLEVQSGTADAIYQAMADVFINLGQHEAAEPLLLKALEIHKAGNYGNDHIDELRIIYSLGVVYRSKAKYSTADSLFRILVEKAGEEDDERLLLKSKGLSELALILKDQGKYGEAKSFAVDALRLLELLSNGENEDVQLVYARAYDRLGDAHRGLGEIQPALSFLNKAIDLRKSVFRTEIHPKVANSLYRLANVYFADGDWQNSLENFSKALGIYRDVYGESHEYTAACYFALGKVYHHGLKSNLNLAYKYYSKSSLIYKEESGPDYLHRASPLVYIGQLLVETDSLLKAEHILEEALGIFKENEAEVSSENRFNIKAQFWLGISKLKRGQTSKDVEDLLVNSVEEAIKYLREGDGQEMKRIVAQEVIQAFELPLETFEEIREDSFLLDVKEVFQSQRANLSL